MERALATLPLAGYHVPVVLVEGLAESAGADGQWSPERRVIELDAGLAEDERLEVLLHECLHAVADLYGRRLSEATVRTLALGLHQMLGGVLRLTL